MNTARKIWFMLGVVGVIVGTIMLSIRAFAAVAPTAPAPPAQEWVINFIVLHDGQIEMVFTYAKNAQDAQAKRPVVYDSEKSCKIALTGPEVTTRIAEFKKIVKKDLPPDADTAFACALRVQVKPKGDNDI